MDLTVDNRDIFISRQRELKKLINEDIVFIDSPENLYYYTGFTGGEAVFLFVADNKCVAFSDDFDKTSSNSDCLEDVLHKYGKCIITDSRYYEQVEKECPDIHLVRLDNRTYLEVIKDLLSKFDANDILTIAVEDSMNLSRYLKLKDGLNKCELKVSGDIINKPRMIKDDNELELLRKAESIGDEAFTHILDVIKPGITEFEIALELEFFMKKHGASKLSFDTIVASGPNSSMPHAQVTDRVVQNGDFVTMDFGCVYNGYCSDMTRTIAVGNPTDEMKNVYQTVLNANMKAMEGIRAGVKCCDIDAIARDHIKANGYGEYFGHGLGHSVGLYIHEEPRFSPKCDTITKENMAITNEPGIYLPGKFGVRIEDLVVVKDNGCDILSNSPKELIIL